MIFSMASLEVLLPLSRYSIWSSASVRKFSQMSYGQLNYVGGKRCNPVNSNGNMKVIEPATGLTLCDVPISGLDDVNRAVEDSKRAFSAWKKLSFKERGKFLTKAGAIVRNKLEEISKLETQNNGKPIWESRVDVESVADCLEYFGGIAPSISGEYVTLPNGSFALVVREPYGVVGGIGAWNFPMQTAVWKVAPALACGNTCIYKPSQFTPLTAVTLAEILTEAGVPEGVFNVVQGDGTTGAHLSSHPLVDKLSFTGSVPTGEKIMKSAAVGCRIVTLELGGKSPLIIFEDADIDNAVKAAMVANFLSQGQVCSNGTRVYVHSSIEKEFTNRLVEKTKEMKIGDPMSESTTVGATIHEEQARKVLGYIEDAKKAGAVVLCGGERVKLEGRLANGWYLSPCILSNVNHEMRVVQEEIFGSVLSLMTFDTEEEAIKLANDTLFGLAGGVFTRDLNRAHRVSQALETGTVWINTYNLYPPEVPSGGFKQSGIGRENGKAAIEFFTQTKTIYVEMGDVDAGPLWKD